MTEAKVGDTLPDATVYGKNPSDAIKVREACAGKKVVIIGVPGAFTPTCSDTHLPEYLEQYDKLKELKVDLIACVSVNDAFVMTAWGKDRSVGEKISMWADTQMELTKGLGLELDATSALGSNRCKRFSMVTEDNVIKALFVEDTPSKVSVSGAKDMIMYLSAQ